MPRAAGAIPMTTTYTTPAIDQREALRLEREAGIELVDGQIVEKPASIESSKVESHVSRLLGNFAESTGVADVFGSSLGYRCYRDEPTKFRKPDVSVVRAERLKGIDQREGFMPIPADLVVEVISPTDLHYDVAEKTEEYLKNGFALIWLVIPHTLAVEIYRADGSITLLHENDEITGENALPGFRCKVAEFFVKPS
jgi:Uma2 family endonuclease